MSEKTTQALSDMLAQSVYFLYRRAEFITTLVAVCYCDLSDDCSYHLYVSSPFVKSPAATAMDCGTIYCDYHSAAALTAIARTALGRSATITLERQLALPRIEC